MDRVKLNDDLDFSRLIYGMWRIGDVEDTSPATVEAKINACLEQGITTFDQADIYGDYGAEAILGGALKANPSLRSQMEIVTKCDIVAPIGRYSDKACKYYDTSRAHIEASVDMSLRDMGIEPFLLASTVTGIAAQRLVRRLCSHCKEPHTPTENELVDLGLSKRTKGPFFRPVGCPACHNIGYVGRLALYEIIIMDDELRAMIHDGAREVDMAAHAFKNRRTLLQSGAQHVINGNTSVEEVLRVCRAKAAET